MVIDVERLAGSELPVLLVVDINKKSPVFAKMRTHARVGGLFARANGDFECVQVSSFEEALEIAKQVGDRLKLVLADSMTPRLKAEAARVDDLAVQRDECLGKVLGDSGKESDEAQLGTIDREITSLIPVRGATKFVRDLRAQGCRIPADNLVVYYRGEIMPEHEQELALEGACLLFVTYVIGVKLTRLMDGALENKLKANER